MTRLCKSKAVASMSNELRNCAAQPFVCHSAPLKIALQGIFSVDERIVSRSSVAGSSPPLHAVQCVHGLQRSEAQQATNLKAAGCPTRPPQQSNPEPWAAKNASS
jgi:hypothetical protein